ncbi:MAG: hypothetical protein ACPGU4_12210 [Flavobacteriales bacterium]
MKIKLILAFVLPVLFSACGNHSHEQEKIELNAGQKWKVNEEMKPHIEKGREMLSAYLTDGDTDYEKLAADLQEQNSKLIKSCTMDGKSHDELHKWLHPHLKLVKQLSDAENLEEANKITKELTVSFETYAKHFE